jgi:hypothetical protein
MEMTEIIRDEIGEFLDSKVALFSYEKDKLKRSFVTQFFEENEEWLSREVLIFKSMTKKNL